MKRVRMIRTKHMQRGSQRYRYDEGKVFYLPLNVAKMFIQEGSAMEDKSVDAPSETKAKPKRKKKAI